MPDTKITDLTAGTVVDPANDQLVYVDVSDTTMDASGTTKKLTPAVASVALNGFYSAISPSSITSDQNDYNPTGLATANYVKVSATSQTVSNVTLLCGITGLAGGSDGRVICLRNVGTWPIKLYGEDASTASTAANRFRFRSAIVYLDPDQAITLVYDSTNSRWTALDEPEDTAAACVFGGGTTGNLYVNSNLSLASVDAYYQNLTFNSANTFNPSGQRVYVSEVLDLSVAISGAIFRNANNGGNASGATQGGAGSASNGNTVATGLPGGSGGAGNTGAGSNGGTGGGSGQIGGTARTAGGAGGAGVSAGGTGGTGTAGIYGPCNAIEHRLIAPFAAFGLAQATNGGNGGGGGGGDGSNAGGGGGGGGAGGHCLQFYARYVYTGSNANASILKVLGGNGGNGGNPSAGNTGGGGGGAGGNGGYIYFVYGRKIGGSSTNSAFFAATGGSGGTGGTKQGTGVNGTGGGSGYGGRIILISALMGTISDVGGDATNAGSGTTGGTPTTRQQAF